VLSALSRLLPAPVRQLRLVSPRTLFDGLTSSEALPLYRI
jgi:hypothetical protein